MSERNVYSVENQEPENQGSQLTEGRIQTTLEKQGDRLPVGILSGETLYKDIATKRWRTKDERELAKRIPPNASMSEYVSIIVSNMCSRLGPHNMDELDDAKKSVILSTMYMADVFYAYVLLRVKALGPNLDLEVPCPRPGCGVKFPFTANLNTLDVVSVENPDDILWTYKLHDPIAIRNTEVTEFQMAYPKWSVMAKSRGNKNEAEVKVNTIVATIVGINDIQEPVLLAMNELDELSKRDFEGILCGINDNFLGPKMSVEGECSQEVCGFKTGGHKFAYPIDWSYQNFFAHSSR